MSQVREALRTLTAEVCRHVASQAIPTAPVWTVVSHPDSVPHVALDIERPALETLRSSLSIGLLNLPEYAVLATAVESDVEFSEGVVIDAGGFLAKPERTNTTRILVTNFLWRYLREGTQLDWDETRFTETYDELKTELRGKTVVFHWVSPLSNLKMNVPGLSFGDEMKILPASPEELERWLNRDEGLGPLGPALPRWNSQYIDSPAVMHRRKSIVGRPGPMDLSIAPDMLPQTKEADAITALRLALNAPISIMFHEQHSEGVMALGGGGTSWSWGTQPFRFGQVETLDEPKAAEVTRVWRLLQTSPNVDRLRVPIRRLESSLLRGSLEDRLIDAWISLEALLLEGLDGELSYRAALRLASLVGGNGPDRKDIYDRTRDSYAWRSAIVHGSTPHRKLAKRLPLEKAIHITTDYLRTALLKVLELSHPFNPNRLEAELLGR